MAILLTGVAGFIGFHVAQVLLERGDEVIGIDNLNDYYDPNLKRARLAQLEGRKGFKFFKADISDSAQVTEAVAGSDIRRIVHLAAQAGVRYSLVNPEAYIRANVLGHTVILELARHLPKCEHLVYASSSSVYGGNTKLPFAVEDRVDSPVSLYAATKKADELLSHAYAHLFRFPQTGLRFFTVYGPWGRPDMALYIFTKAIFEGRPIHVFNNGDMQRDFTYIDDIVNGVIRTLDNPPAPDGQGRPYRLYNIGNNKPEPLLRMIEVLEQAIGRKAEKQLMPMQPGDVKATYADITAISRDVGFAPTTPIDVGVPKFVDWFRRYHNQV
ncbi:MAG TPA: NAD-dependent epimerase/dehydratase family protein [Ferrovibrio sp.]|uniref:NAD-dependent epimerase/dehydratase family protein n=1 Tax=Ferrovibrio sp. TaxID=1917215 RepID=UPI002B4B736B|nr:NAD-dependent epimerase/dehydratase family protein [Ferrovibrio sp.]HLT77895.1 NAD-dependent epimerase/dehydratase family protein [Ferrovibrio sp.]